MDEAQKHPPLQIVPGLEINCDVPSGPDGGPSEIHVLGYCVDWEAGWFQDFLAEQRAERRQRVYRMAERLAELRMPNDPAAALALGEGGPPGRPPLRPATVYPGAVPSDWHAFDPFPP